ncbi:uncharacterized protein [Populus alba]|uniref:uncharacterized protein n=1 Tax=Populus alba TaxID=43335 RepID=UPI003CC789E4
MTSPHGHVQPNEYVPSSPYSQFVLNDYETPVDRILLSNNPSSSKYIICSTTYSRGWHFARLSNPPQSTALASFHCDESEEFSEQTLNHQSTISQVVLPAPQETPNYLDNLLNPNNGSSSKKFRREIRAYNSMFAFTSMGAVVDHSVNSRPGSYVFKVNGYCHHLMGSLLPMDNRGPKFAQLYIFDTDNEVSNRLQPFCNENFQSSLDSQIVVGLINMLDSSNQLVRLFRHADKGSGMSRFQNSKLSVNCLSGTLQRISKLHPKFMSLHYPLLFPYGEDGFHTDIPLAHQEQQPPKKRQKERLDFIRANQENLRSEHYKGEYMMLLLEVMLMDQLQGKLYFPSSLTGSPRYMMFALVEFQKRGLPHTHLLVWLAPEFKFRSPEDVDSIISAEIPDKHQDPICYEIVSKFMMHGPCGAANPKAQCNQSLSSVLGRPGINKTMLTEWFERNRVDVDARDLFYSQFPNKYVWDARQKEWIVRSRGFCLGRIVYVHPAAGELYFLRMLLNHVKGAKNFEDLRQISSTIFPTFQLACKALGLLGDDKEWSDAFGEAIPTASSPQLRQLFINIIMFCEVADPNSLFDQFWHSMHDDIEYHLRSSFSMLNVRFSDDELKNYVLYELEQLFNASGTSLEDHKLSNAEYGRLMDEVRNKLLREELNYDLAELRNNHSLAMPLLNPCQRNIYDSLLFYYLEGEQPILDFKIPLEVNESSTCEIKHNTHLSRLLEMTSLIVWDEAPMNNRFCFEALDRSLRDVLRLNNPFWWQVSEGLSPDQKDELRQFAEWILLIGDGQICDLAVSDDHDAAFIKIPCELQVEVIDSPIAAIVSAIYPDIERAHLDPFYFKDRAIVTPKKPNCF